MRSEKSVFADILNNFDLPNRPPQGLPAPEYVMGNSGAKGVRNVVKPSITAYFVRGRDRYGDLSSLPAARSGSSLGMPRAR